MVKEVISRQVMMNQLQLYIQRHISNRLVDMCDDDQPIASVLLVLKHVTVPPLCEFRLWALHSGYEIMFRLWASPPSPPSRQNLACQSEAGQSHRRPFVGAF